MVTWQIQKPYICSSTIPMATKLGWVVTWVGQPHHQSHVIFWLRGHVTNSKNLYLHFRNTYRHQTWQSGNLPSEDPTYLVRWPFDKVVTWKIQKSSIYSSTIPMATKLGRVVSCKGGTLPSKSRDLLIAWSRYKFCKVLISALPQYLWPLSLAEY